MLKITLTLLFTLRSCMSTITLQSMRTTAVSYGTGGCTEYRPAAGGGVECGSLNAKQERPHGSTRLAVHTPVRPTRHHQLPRSISGTSQNQVEKQGKPEVPAGKDVIEPSTLTGGDSTTEVGGTGGSNTDRTEEENKVQQLSNGSQVSRALEPSVADYSEQNVGQTGRESGVSGGQQNARDNNEEVGRAEEGSGERTIASVKAIGHDSTHVVRLPPEQVGSGAGQSSTAITLTNDLDVQKAAGGSTQSGNSAWRGGRRTILFAAFSLIFS